MVAVEKSRESQISAVAVLEEPINRRQYDYVVCQPDPVGRDQPPRPWRCPSASSRSTWIRTASQAVSPVASRRGRVTAPTPLRPGRSAARQCSRTGRALWELTAGHPGPVRL